MHIRQWRRVQVHDQICRCSTFGHIQILIGFHGDACSGTGYEDE